MDRSMCERFGADKKETIIFELELFAVVLAFHFWENVMRGGLTSFIQ